MGNYWQIENEPDELIDLDFYPNGTLIVTSHDDEYENMDLYNRDDTVTPAKKDNEHKIKVHKHHHWSPFCHYKCDDGIRRDNLTDKVRKIFRK